VFSRQSLNPGGFPSGFVGRERRTIANLFAEKLFLSHFAELCRNKKGKEWSVDAVEPVPPFFDRFLQSLCFAKRAPGMCGGDDGEILTGHHGHVPP